MRHVAVGLCDRQFPILVAALSYYTAIDSKTGGKINSKNMFCNLAKALNLYARTYNSCVVRTLFSQAHTYFIFPTKCNLFFRSVEEKSRGKNKTAAEASLLSTSPHIPKSQKKRKQKIAEIEIGEIPPSPLFFPFIRKVLFFFGRIFGGKRRKGGAPKFANIPVSSRLFLGLRRRRDRQTDKKEKESRMFSSFISGQSLLCPLFCRRGFAKIVYL